MKGKLPYFKFLVSEWLSGDIVHESLELQGLFINICALYWKKEGDLSVNEVNNRYKKPNALDSLIGRFIWVSDNEKLSIKFLDEQLHERCQISTINSKNGKLGGRPKAAKTLGKKPNANRTLTEPKANESHKEEEKEQDIRIRIDKGEIPTLEIVLNWLKIQSHINFLEYKFPVTSKYEAWIASYWHDGLGKPIKNWKSKMLNAIPHMTPIKQVQTQNYVKI